MKKIVFIVLGALFLVSCNQNSSKEKKSVAEEGKKVENVKELSFDEQFKTISPEEFSGNVFNLVGKDFTVITAGDETLYNSMTAGWGGLGILFNKPTTWCFLRANRYTLELIQQEQKYTMSYFPDEYKDQVLFLGSKSGKDTDKMKETTLTHVQTPSGSISFKEAKIIIECKLIEISTVTPEDYYTEEGKNFISDAYKEVGDYHKLVFGEITNIWVNK